MERGVISVGRGVLGIVDGVARGMIAYRRRHVWRTDDEEAMLLLKCCGNQ